jgi:dTDP-4-dehydrorhamnose reductase
LIAAAPQAPPGIRWVVTGAGGLLGHDVLAVLAGRTATSNDAVSAYTRAELDITDHDAVDEAVRGHDVVVNAAAWTDVDGAESNEDAAYAVNAVGAERLATACARHGARLVHVSTDYVFDGTASAPYAEDAPTGPRSAYGRTKLAGEHAILATHAEAFIVRTAWVYGEHGKNFVTTMLRLARGDDPVQVVDDQTGSPTWSHDLAAALMELGASSAAPGVYHATNAGTVTWWGLARAVFAGAGADPDRVRKTTSADFPRPAPRPAYSVLGGARWTAAGLSPMRPWPEALAESLPRLMTASAEV